MNLFTTSLKYLMFSMGAKPNGSEKTFSVDTAFIRTLVLAMLSLMGAAFAAGGIAPKAKSITPRIYNLEQELAETKKDVRDLRQTNQTQNAVMMSKLDMILSQVGDLQRAGYSRR